jgi:putative hydrolase of HD superfamily
MDYNIKLRNLKLDDLDDYFYNLHPSREFHKFNGPYFHQKSISELKKHIEILRKYFTKNKNYKLDNKKLIVDITNNKLVGQVNWYWNSKETFWMEIGIVIFDKNYWGKNIGYNALKLWINYLFNKYPLLVRIGLSTWSGNTRMINLSKKLGFIKEAHYRKARIVNDKYYDSISYGILKEEWYEKTTN